MDEQNSIPEIVSINQLCSLMGISRSRYYQILSEGLILPPVYAPDSKRPYFTRELAMKNLTVKKNNIGVNGKICIFYNSNRSPISSPKINTKNNEKKKNTTNKNTDLLDGLNALGLVNVKPTQVDDALNKCFPNGTDNVDEGEILRQVFCQISKQNSTDNVSG